MPRVTAIPNIREMRRHIQNTIDAAVYAPSNKRLRSDPDMWVQGVLGYFPFVSNNFGIFLANFVGDRERKLNKIDPDWADGSMFNTISYLPSTGKFTFTTNGITVEDLLVLVAMYKEGIERMEPRTIKEITGYTLTHIRQMAELVSE